MIQISSFPISIQPFQSSSHSILVYLCTRLPQILLSMNTIKSCYERINIIFEQNRSISVNSKCEACCMKSDLIKNIKVHASSQINETNTLTPASLFLYLIIMPIIFMHPWNHDMITFFFKICSGNDLMHLNVWCTIIVTRPLWFKHFRNGAHVPSRVGVYADFAILKISVHHRLCSFELDSEKIKRKDTTAKYNYLIERSRVFQQDILEERRKLRAELVPHFFFVFIKTLIVKKVYAICVWNHWFM